MSEDKQEVFYLFSNGMGGTEDQRNQTALLCTWPLCMSQDGSHGGPMLSHGEQTHVSHPWTLQLMLLVARKGRVGVPSEPANLGGPSRWLAIWRIQAISFTPKSSDIKLNTNWRPLFRLLPLFLSFFPPSLLSFFLSQHLFFTKAMSLKYSWHRIKFSLWKYTLVTIRHVFVE